MTFSSSLLLIRWQLTMLNCANCFSGKNLANLASISNSKTSCPSSTKGIASEGQPIRSTLALSREGIMVRMTNTVCSSKKYCACVLSSRAVSKLIGHFLSSRFGRFLEQSASRLEHSPVRSKLQRKECEIVGTFPALSRTIDLTRIFGLFTVWN